MLRDDPRSEQFAQLADAYTRDDRYHDAVRVCRRGLRVHPAHPAGHLALGRALFGLGDLAAAARSLREAIALDQKDPESYRLLAEVLLRRSLPVEAAQVVEEGLLKSVETPALQSLRERTLEVLGTETTTVWREQSDPRAEAGDGTAHADSTFDLVDPDADATVRDVSPPAGSDARAAEVGTAPLVEPRVGSTALTDADETPAAVDWEGLGKQWRIAIAAADDRPSDPLTELPEPFARHAVRLDVDVAPLSDPLAEGMPPLPEDEPDGDELLEAMRTNAVEQLLPGESWGGSQSGSISALSPMDDAMSGVGAARGAADPSVTGFLGGTADSGGYPAPAIGQHLPHRAVYDGFSAAEGAFLGQHEFVAPISAGVSRRQRSIGLVVGALVAVVLVSGALVAWWMLARRHRVNAALERARIAQHLGAGNAIAAQLEALRQVGERRDSPKIQAEIELMEALAWLLDARGAPPKISGANTQWSRRAARAAVALAAGKPALASELLAGGTPDPSARALDAVLVSWASWLRGRPRMALRQIEQAIERHNDSLLIRVLRGHVYRELGDVESAERSYRAVLLHRSDHLLAGLGLAALLVQRNPGAAELRAWIETPTDSPLAKDWQRVLRAEQRWAGGKQEAADDLVRAAAAARPRRELLSHAVRALARACRFEAAGTMLAQLQDSGAAKPDLGARVLAGEVALLHGQERKAVDEFGSEIVSAHHRHQLVWALLLLGRFKQATTLVEADTSDGAPLYRALVEGFSSTDAPLAEGLRSGPPAVRLGLAMVLRWRNKRAEARALAGELINTASVASQARTLIAEEFVDEGKPAKALAALQRALKRCSSFLPAQAALGRLQVQLGAYEPGVASLEQARAAGLRDAASSASLARALPEVGRIDQAEAMLGESTKEGAGEDDLRIARVALLLARGEAEKALDRLRKAPDTFEVSLMRARAYLKQERFPEAEVALLHAVQQDAGHPLPHLLLGKLFRRQQSPEAIVHLRKALELASQRPYLPNRWVAEAQTEIARIGIPQGRPSAMAFSALEAAIKADPSYAVAYRLLGQCHLSLGHRDQARRLLQQSIELDHKDADSLYLLGMADRGRRASLKRIYRRFLELEPSGWRADRVRQLLRKLR